MIRSSSLLRTALAIDALASGAMAIAMSMASQPLAALLQLPPALVLEAGLFLVPYSLFVGWTASHTTLPRSLVVLVIVGNSLWTLGSITLLAGSFVTPNLLGSLFVAAQAIAVGIFAELQFVGVRRSEAQAAV